MSFLSVTGDTRRRVGFVGRAALVAPVLIFGVWCAFNLIEMVDADEIVVIQSRLTGSLTWYSVPGYAVQLFGKVTRYPKRATFSDEQTVRFNDGGHGTMKDMSVQWEMPTDPKQLNEIHMKFGNAANVEKALVGKVVTKAVYMTGPMMSSKESYAEKRNYLISYVEDQIAHGVYKTVEREVRTEDPMHPGQGQTSKVVDIVQKGGQPDRQEESPLERFGIRTSNFSFKSLDYSPEVEAQIQKQQQIVMDVQTAIAESRKAEQRAQTIEAQGKASAAEARWKQEVLKATATTQAEQEKAVALTAAERDRTVAETKVKTAEAYKTEQTLRGEADATYRRKVLEADGALAAKLATYEKVNATWAAAFQAYTGPLVPSVVMGGPGGSGNAVAGAQGLMDILTVKLATDLGLAMRPVPAHAGGK